MLPPLHLGSDHLKKYIFLHLFALDYIRMKKSRMYAMYLKAYLNGYTLLPQEKQASIPFKNSPWDVASHYHFRDGAL